MNYNLFFQGWMNLEMEVVKETKQIVLNAAELEIGKITLDNGKTLDQFKLDEEAETLTIDLPEALTQGSRANMFCAYTGTLNDQMRGFYRSKYTMDGETRYCASTQFEATDARR